MQDVVGGWVSVVAVLSGLSAIACDRPLEAPLGGSESARSGPANKAASTVGTSMAPLMPIGSPIARSASAGTVTASPPATTVAPRTDRQAGGGPLSGSTQRCPARPPKTGSACSDPALACHYVDCPGAGELTVHCARGRIVSETLPCASFSCGGGAECGMTEVCVERKGGSHQTKCVPNPCGKNAVGCDCAGHLCGGDACTTHGRIISCGAPCDGCP
jgi:hypothetical protein